MSQIYTFKDHVLILDNQDKKYILKIRDLPLEEKPREKLIKYGPSVLSMNELLAVVLSVGTKIKAKNVLEEEKRK